MAKTYVLFNPIAGGGQYQESLDKLKTLIGGDLELCDMTCPDTYEKTIPAMSEDEMLTLLASDGMLVKRPLLIGDDFVFVGFKESEWKKIMIK